MRKVTSLVSTCLFLGLVAFGQSTGSISGTLVDQSDAAVPNAQVQLVDVNRQFNQITTSDQTGRFTFAAVQPGRYTIEVKASGFKTFERRDLTVQAADRLSIGNLRLEVGTVTETVEVSGAAIVLKTESAERSDVLVTKQIENIAVNGRSYLAFVTLTPGVVSTANFQVAGTGGLGAISANGTRTNQNQLTLNGISNVDTGNNGDQLATISLDSVQEYRILSGTYQAEYGRSAGAQITVVSKSGTSGFHGSGYYYRRHDSMNANTWLRNRDGLPRQLYRFQNPGYTIGGPAYIPGVFNRNKDRLFFFWSQEYQRQLQPEGPRTVTVPTELERRGDFSQSLDNAGRPFPFIRDPLAGLPCNANDTRGCFADGGVLGRIPASRLFAPGMALLNFFPMPNRDQRQFLNNNYLSQISTRRPRREDLLRVDGNISDNVRAFFHWIRNDNSFTTPYGSFVLGTNLGMIPITDARPGKSYGGGTTWVINPTTTLETTVGWGRNDILIDLADGGAALSRTATGINLPLLFPEAVQRDFMPSFTFNGTRLSNSPSIGTNNAPFVNYNDTLDIVNNFSKIITGHVLKFGAYIQRSRKDQTSFANANGNYNWGDNPNNPFDTGFGYANAALGVYNSFQQAGRYANGMYRYVNAEFYAQDTWKITRRFTLDYGMRMAWIQPQYDAGRIVSSFDPNQFNPARAMRLFQPGRDANNNAIAIDPVSGRTEGSFAVGRLVPGSGDLLNGIIQPDKHTNKYLQRNRGIHWGPRLGFAYDLTGEQNFVIRGGGGIYYDRFQGNRVFDLLTNPPTVVQPLLNFGFARDINPATALVGPPSLVMADPTGVVPTVYNYSIGIQNKLPFNTVLETSYVGSLSRHLQNNRNLNAVPYGTLYLPGTTTVNTAIPNADFVRPYQGYGNINIYEGTATSNYNSLQVSLNRRMASGLFFGLAYTWSKALGTGSGDGDFFRIDSLQRFANYGLLSFHRAHNLAANFIYELPDLSRWMGGGAVGRGILGGWQFSGIYQYLSNDNPEGIGFAVPGVANPQLTGSFTEGARVRLIGDPTAGVPSGDPYFNINPAAFAPPQPGSLGLESGVRYFLRPGVNNWNMSITKIFRIAEQMNLQLRADAFNVFNHTQFSDYNRTINFRSLADPTPTNFTRGPGGFGAVTAVRDPRIMQLMVRFQF
jgi:hypothetical protein